ncbi:unnamed protein product, partial [Ectocarpus sp. 13 AM-2016]
KCFPCLQGVLLSSAERQDALDLSLTVDCCVLSRRSCFLFQECVAIFRGSHEESRNILRLWRFCRLERTVSLRGIWSVVLSGSCAFDWSTMKQIWEVSIQSDQV